MLCSVSIKYKLLSVLLGIGAAAIVITGWLGYVAGKEGLTQTATNQLTGIRRSKAHQIEAYFGSIRSQVRMLSQSRMAIEALREFRSEFRKADAPQPSADLKALIAAAKEIAGPGMLVPTRNGELFRWCLAQGLRVVQPMTLMSLGLYQAPRGPWTPSILY